MDLYGHQLQSIHWRRRRRARGRTRQGQRWPAAGSGSHTIVSCQCNRRRDLDSCILRSREFGLTQEQVARPNTLNIIIIIIIIIIFISFIQGIHSMSPRQTMSLVDTLLQLLFRFIVNTLYGAYLPRSYVGSDGLLRQHYYYHHHHHYYYVIFSNKNAYTALQQKPLYFHFLAQDLWLSSCSFPSRYNNFFFHCREFQKLWCFETKLTQLEVHNKIVDNSHFLMTQTQYDMCPSAGCIITQR